MPNPLITNPTDINLSRDDEVQQIFGRPPSWTLNWGILVIFVFFTGVMAGAYFIEYPDTVVAPVQITTENPPISVVARTSGKINKLLIENGTIVSAQQPIAELENTASQTDINQLAQFIKKAIVIDNRYDFLALDIDDNLQLGALQTSYANFLQDRQDLDFYLENRHAGKQRRALRKQIEQLENLNRALTQQEGTQREIVKLIDETLRRRTGLQADGLESLEGSEAAREKKLRAQKELESIDNQRITNDLRIAEINTQILSLRQDDSTTGNQKWQQVKEDIQQLQRELTEWQHDYLLVAPIAGEISMPEILTEQQFVKAGEELLTIVPTGSAGAMIAQAQLPITNSGKVSERDSVNIRLNGFPYQEYGIIRGEVTEIAAVPNAEGTSYLVEIELPNGLATTYHQELDFRQQMRGEAHIITKKRRIMERIFDPLVSALYNRP